MLDEVKEDLRKEFVSKLELDQFESRITDLEDDSDQIHLSMEID